MKVFLLEGSNAVAKETTKIARVRKAETMRDKADKAQSSKAKPRRIKKASTAVKKPLRSAKEILTKDYYFITPTDSGMRGFFTKKRRFIPRYFRDSYSELKLVTWPNRSETWKLMWAVFIFALAFGLLVTVVDYGLEKLFREAFL
jgi:preprotein translocase SecE subunit